MQLVKQKNGTWIPFCDLDHKKAMKMKAGTVVKATNSRNPHHHRKGFAILNIGFDNQEQFTEFEIYRKVITMRAGYYDTVIDKNGNPFPIVQSLKFSEMSQTKFEEFYQAMLNVIAKDLKITPEELGNNV